MRAYSFDFADASVVVLITITRNDGEVIRIVNWPFPVTIGSLTWLPWRGVMVGDVVEYNDGSPATFSFKLAAEDGGLFDPLDIANGKYDGAMVLADLANADNPTATNFHYFGQVGSIDATSLDAVTFDVRSPYGFPRDVIVPTFTLMCSTAFGSQYCRKLVMCPLVARSEIVSVGEGRRYRFGSDGTPEDFAGVYLEATAITTGITSDTEPAFSSTVNDTVVDGGVTWTTRTALEQPAQIASVVDAHNFTLDRVPDAINGNSDSWYSPGSFQMQSGYSNNRATRIGRYRSSLKQVTTYLPIGLVVDAGDWLLVWPDCDKTMTMCDGKYDNAVNYQGFPYQAGAAAAAAQGLG